MSENNGYLLSLRRVLFTKKTVYVVKDSSVVVAAGSDGSVNNICRRLFPRAMAAIMFRQFYPNVLFRTRSNSCVLFAVCRYIGINH